MQIKNAPYNTPLCQVIMGPAGISYQAVKQSNSHDYVTLHVLINQKHLKMKNCTHNLSYKIEITSQVLSCTNSTFPSVIWRVKLNFLYSSQNTCSKTDWHNLQLCLSYCCMQHTLNQAHSLPTVRQHRRLVCLIYTKGGFSFF
jgi:hypothetical protein